MGQSEYALSDSPLQRPRGRYSRVCLLKGCEKPFQPSHPLSRYCSQSCQDAARQWRRWRAARRYRSTPQGRQQRCVQSRRYRERQRLRRATAAAEQAVKEAAAAKRYVRAVQRLKDALSGMPGGLEGL